MYERYVENCEREGIEPIDIDEYIDGLIDIGEG